MTTYRQQGGPGALEWRSGFAAMIEFARSRGWASPSGEHVHAHWAE